MEKRLIADNVWTQGDTLSYQVNISDTSLRYHIGLELKHDVDYDFQNLYIQIQTRFPQGRTLNQPISLDMADHRGSWYGDCNRTDCNLKIMLQENARFEQLGEHRFVITPFMRKDSIEGISSIGLFIDRS